MKSSVKRNISSNGKAPNAYLAAKLNKENVRIARHRREERSSSECRFTSNVTPRSMRSAKFIRLHCEVSMVIRPTDMTKYEPKRFTILTQTNDTSNTIALPRATRAFNFPSPSITASTSCSGASASKTFCKYKTIQITIRMQANGPDVWIELECSRPKTRSVLSHSGRSTSKTFRCSFIAQRYKTAIEPERICPVRCRIMRSPGLMMLNKNATNKAA